MHLPQLCTNKVGGQKESLVKKQKDQGGSRVLKYGLFAQWGVIFWEKVFFSTKAYQTTIRAGVPKMHIFILVPKGKKINIVNN